MAPGEYVAPLLCHHVLSEQRTGSHCVALQHQEEQNPGKVFAR